MIKTIELMKWRGCSYEVATTHDNGIVFRLADDADWNFLNKWQSILSDSFQISIIAFVNARQLRAVDTEELDLLSLEYRGVYGNK